jgi:glycosyltransferase involved in cell wall biosynthesis
MAMNSPKPKIACLVPAGWRTNLSGLDSFVRMVAPDWIKEFDCELIEYDKTLKNAPQPAAKPDNPVKPRFNPSKQLNILKDIRLALGYSKLLLRDIIQLKKERHRLKDRLVICNEFGCETLPIALRCLFPTMRLVAIAHTHPGDSPSASHWVRSLVEKICYRSVSELVFNSQGCFDEWKKKLGVRALKHQIIHHGLKPPDLSIPKDYPEKPDNCIDFLYLAKFYSWKGQLEFLDAWSKFMSMPERSFTDENSHLDKPAETGFRLIFIGDGVNLDAARQKAAELGLNSSVIFLGGKPNGALYFNAADVAVLLSQEAEAFGIVLLEAMSRGLPVLASNLGGIPEVVADGETGVLVDPNKTELISANLHEFASKPCLRAKLGDAGKRRWSSCFSYYRMVKSYNDLFTKIIHNKYN